MKAPTFKHAVWPVHAPSTCYGNWTQADWERYENLNRPNDYQGARHDAAAWAEYLTRRAAE